MTWPSLKIISLPSVLELPYIYIKCMRTRGSGFYSSHVICRGHTFALISLVVRCFYMYKAALGKGVTTQGNLKGQI